MWTVEVFEADDGTMPFQRFANSLSDSSLRHSIWRSVLAGRGLDLATSEFRQVAKDFTNSGFGGAEEIVRCAVPWCERQEGRGSALLWSSCWGGFDKLRSANNAR